MAILMLALTREKKGDKYVPNPSPEQKTSGYGT